MKTNNTWKIGSEVNMSVILEIDLEKCTGCGVCVQKCPTQAVAVVNGKVVVLRPDLCNYCAECETFCDVGAIKCPFEIILVEPEASKAQTEK